MDELQLAREGYVDELRYRAHLRSDAVIRAFTIVERERFLGPGPWQILNLFDGSYWWTPDANPKHIYHDVLVAIDPERKLNNGQPSGLAYLIEALELQPGAHVVHLGCGTGYYTAIIAHAVGETGRVTAVELDPILAVKPNKTCANSNRSPSFPLMRRNMSSTRLMQFWSTPVPLIQFRSGLIGFVRREGYFCL